MLYGELPVVCDAGMEGPEVKGFLFSIPNPKKTAVLRLPTSPEMKEYAEAEAKARRRDNTSPTFKADLALFKKIKVAGEDFDEFEARFAVYKLIQATVKACKRTEDGGFEVTLTTGLPVPKAEEPRQDEDGGQRSPAFCETTHFLGIPTAKQYMEALSARKGGSRGARLYDCVIEKSEGYAAGVEVPLHHREAVGAALADAVAAIYDGGFEVPNPPSPQTSTESVSAG